MLTQKKPSRSYGPRFAAYVAERAEILAAESRARSAEQASLRASTGAGEDMNSVRVDHGLDLELVEDWEIERLDNFAVSTQAVNSMSSYKAQKCQNSDERQPEGTQSGAAAGGNPNPSTSQKNALAGQQGGASNAEVALLLERYGDIRGVVKNHPLFRRIQKPVAEGGWGTELAGLIWLAKEHGLGRVLWAAREANSYQGSRSRGAIFTHAVRNGLETCK